MRKPLFEMKRDPVVELWSNEWLWRGTRALMYLALYIFPDMRR